MDSQEMPKESIKGKISQIYSEHKVLVISVCIVCCIAVIGIIVLVVMLKSKNNNESNDTTEETFEYTKSEANDTFDFANSWINSVTCDAA